MKNLKLIISGIGIAVIFGFTANFLQFKSFLDIFPITVGLMTIIIGIASEKGETKIYFTTMFVVNMLQWFILIYMLFINPSIVSIDLVTLMTLSIAPVMTIYLIHRIFRTNIKSNGTNQDSKNYANFVEQVKTVLNNKAKIVLIYVGIVIILGFLVSFSQSKSPEPLYCVSIGLLIVVYGVFRENNKTHITMNYFVTMLSIILLQWIFLILSFFQFDGPESVSIALTITASISLYFWIQISESDLKYLGKKRKIDEKDNECGYMVCNECNRYYKLKPDDSPRKFPEKCECGGELKYKDMIWDQS